MDTTSNRIDDTVEDISAKQFNYYCATMRRGTKEHSVAAEVDTSTRSSKKGPATIQLGLASRLFRAYQCKLPAEESIGVNHNVLWAEL